MNQLQVTEEWRDIPGYPGSYEVSNLGNVRSLRDSQPVLMRLTKSSQGAMLVKLYLHGFGQTYRVAALVWSAFQGPTKEPIYHKDRDAANNNFENLTLERTK